MPKTSRSVESRRRICGIVNPRWRKSASTCSSSTSIGVYRRSVNPPASVRWEAIAGMKRRRASHHCSCRAVRPVMTATSRDEYSFLSLTPLLLARGDPERPRNTGRVEGSQTDAPRPHDREFVPLMSIEYEIGDERRGERREQDAVPVQTRGVKHVLHCRRTADRRQLVGRLRPQANAHLLKPRAI